MAIQHGTIYIGSDDTKLYSLNPNGSQRWSRPTGGRVQSTPAIGADGTVFFGSYDWRMYSMGTNGATNWTYTTGFNIFSSPVIGANGVLYVGSKDTKLYALPASTYPARAMWPTFRRNLRHTAEAATIWLQPGFSYPPDEFGDYRFDFDIYGLPNQSGALESSGDLVNWTSAGTFTTMADGIGTVPATHIGPTYYRAKSGDVRSLNVLGVAILTNPASTQILMANPFNTPNNTVAAILPGVPEGTKFSKWNDSTQSYQTNTFSSGQWSDLGMTLRPGEGGLLTNPSSATLEIHLQGEVLQGDLTNSIPSGVSIRSSMVPQGGLIQSNLGFIPTGSGNIMLLIDGQWDDPYYFLGGQWQIAEPALAVGQAARIESSANVWRRRYFVW